MNYEVEILPVAIGAICMILILLGIGIMVEKFKKTEYVDDGEGLDEEGYEIWVEARREENQ